MSELDQLLANEDAMAAAMLRYGLVSPPPAVCPCCHRGPVAPAVVYRLRGGGVLRGVQYRPGCPVAGYRGAP